MLTASPLAGLCLLGTFGNNQLGRSLFAPKPSRAGMLKDPAN